MYQFFAYFCLIFKLPRDYIYRGFNNDDDDDDNNNNNNNNNNSRSSSSSSLIAMSHFQWLLHGG